MRTHIFHTDSVALFCVFMRGRDFGWRFLHRTWRGVWCFYMVRRHRYALRCAAAGCCGLGRFVGGVRASRLSCALKRIVARARERFADPIRGAAVFTYIYSVLEVGLLR